jgi:hypothetical protein
MADDPIVAEVRRFREQRAARFGYDPRAIARDVRKRERKHGARLVSRAVKPAPVRSR